MVSIGGAVMIFRLLDDGTEDRMFGKQGYIIDTIGNQNQTLYETDIAIDRWGRTVAVPTTGPLAVRRYGREGRMDSGFGDAGTYTRSDLFGTNVFSLSDGKILIVALTSNNLQLGLLRLTHRGRPDPDFGQNGLVLVDNQTEVIPYSAALQDDGSLVIGLQSEIQESNTLLRLLSDGSPDPSFGEAGVVALPTTWGGPRFSLQSDGKIVAAGLTWTNPGYAFALARILPDGSFDNW
jgi:uncharacterized delta-60 repeat protein